MAALTPPVAAITGGNRGLGLETGRQLAQRGLSVVLASRDPAQGQRAAGHVGIKPLQGDTRIVDKHLDLADLLA